MPVIGPQISGHVGSLTGNTLALVVGVAAAVWTGLGVTLAIGNALDHVWAVPQPDRHGFVKARIRALLLLASLGTITVAATATVGLATAGTITPAIPRVLGITAAFGIDLAVFLASFRLLTAAPVTTRPVLPGAVLAAVRSLLQQALGGVYVTQVLKGRSRRKRRDEPAWLKEMQVLYIEVLATHDGPEPCVGCS